MSDQQLTMNVQTVDFARIGAAGGLPARLAAGDVPDGFPLLDAHALAVPVDGEMLDRAGVATALGGYNASVGNPLTNGTLDALRHDARLIITGQQPGLCTGPLYTFLKAATTISLCAKLQPHCDAPLLPAFWLATEDHDIEEVNRVTIDGRTLVIDHAELHGGPRPPVGRISLLPARDRILAFLEDALRTYPHGRDVVDAAADCDFADYGRLCATLLVKLFGAGRLVLVDPMTLRQLAAPVLARMVERRAAIREALQTGAATLRAAGIAPPLDRANLFEFVEGRRMRLNLDDHRLSPEQLRQNILDEPERYSPSAALRPIVQDAVLPTLATVGGPSELAYLWQIDGIYQAMGVERSRLWPRCSATFIDHRIAQAAAKFGLTGEAIFDAPAKLAAYDALSLDREAGDLDRVAALRDQLLDAIGQATGEASTKRVAKARRSIDYQVKKVIAGVRERRLSKQGLGKGDLGRVAAAVCPSGKPQERERNVLALIGRYGWSFADRAMNELDPLTIAHHLVEIRAEGEAL